MNFPLLRCCPSQWSPEAVKVTMNLRMEASIVATDHEQARLNFGHVVVLDDFVSEDMRNGLLELVTEKGWSGEAVPPASKWERETSDQAGFPKTWGLKDEYLAELAKGNHPALQEVHARLCKLYPEVCIAHMPSDLIQELECEPDTDPEKHRLPDDPCNALDIRLSPKRDAQGPANRPDQCEEEIEPTAVDCNAFVANAAVYGDCFQWHVDADPLDFGPSKWVEAFGTYLNGDPGKPLFVSLIVYLDGEWHRGWDAETLFLDTPTDTGLFIRPKSGRVVLMDQDVLHRISTPSRQAERPRFSLVWKLVFFPKASNQACCIAKPEWGPPVYFGSAARVRGLRDMALRKRAREQ